MDLLVQFPVSVCGFTDILGNRPTENLMEIVFSVESVEKIVG